MNKPRLLDLFCCEGGAGKGYSDAGFDVVGVDIEHQRRYPFRFFQGDALAVLSNLLDGYLLGNFELGDFAAIHASPPCQAYSITKHSHSVQHVELIEPVREALIALGKPYVIENVPGAPLRDPLTLCGTEFGLKATDADGEVLWLKRHRLFESNVDLWGAGGCNCTGRTIGGVYGGGSSDRNHAKEVRRGGYTPGKEVRARLIGCDWMTLHGLSQSIPPAYTKHIGEQLLAVVKAGAAA